MKIKLPVFVHWVTRSWMPDAHFEAWSQDMTGCGSEFVLVGQTEIEYEIPEGFDPRPQQVAALRDEKQKILADAHVKAERIEEQIQRLQALEFKEE